MFRFVNPFILLIIILIFSNRFPLQSEINEEGSPYIVVHADNNAGMFAMFILILGCLKLYDEGKLSGIHVNFNNGLYLDLQRGPNWWEYYFEPIHIGDEAQPKQTLSLPEICLLGGCQGLGLSRKKAFELIQKYVFLKPHIKKKVDRFVDHHFEKSFVIGVHHRGTDKKLEAMPVSYETTCQALQRVIKRLSKEHQRHYKIYVATDDQKFLDYLSDVFPREKLIYNDFIRSTNDQPLHFNDHFYANNYQKGKEALLDCLLLSKCNYLIFPHTSSLSIISAFLNPFMPILPLREHLSQ